LARRCSTLCLPIGKDDYAALIGDPGRSRAWPDRRFRAWPELFPRASRHGYRLKDARAPSRAGLRLRRIRLKAAGAPFSVRPSFPLPYLTGTTDEAQGPLSLRAFGVPFWALARAFGRDDMYWYRPEVSLGRNSVVGTTARRAELPEHLPADEHHQRRDGAKNYIATTVGAGCCLGAELAPTAGADDLTAAYAVFEQEAQEAQPDYRPQTVSVDGWASTRRAWAALFPLVVLLRCFLHGWLNMRSRGKLSEAFRDLSGKAGEAYHAPDRRCFAQRLRRLLEWARGQALSAWLLGQVQKLCGRSREYGRAYSYPGGHRTRNMLDRVMRSMRRYFGQGQHLHGSPEAAGRHARAWALLQNFRPWGKEAVKASGGWHSPAERLNGHRYQDDWLQNLLVSASLGGYRR
jgi:hypothetical protein